MARVMAVLLIAGIGQACAAATYTITDLGTLGGSDSTPTAINASGQVVGYSTDWSNQNAAFVYSAGTITSLGTLGGASSFARGINASGQIVGYGPDASAGYWDNAFIYSGGVLSRLGKWEGSYSSHAYAINDFGVVAGTVSTNWEMAATWSGGQWQLAGGLGGHSSYAFAINNTGQVAGQASLSDTSPAVHAYLYDSPTGNYDLGTLGGTSSAAYGLNASAQVVGYSQVAGDWTTHAFLYAGGVMTDLGTLGGNSSSANGINALGQIVGSAADTDGINHGFLYSEGAMLDLNDLIVPGSGWTIVGATAINDSGMIAASARNQLSQYHAVLLTPTPEPAALPLVAAGIWLAARRRKRAPLATE